MGNKSKDKKEKNQTKDLSDMQENNSTKSDNNSSQSEENILEKQDHKESSFDKTREIEDKLSLEIEVLKEEKLRVLAEMENLRKRLEKEKIDSIQYGNINLARDILSIHDNLARALNAITETNDLPDIVKNIVGGLEMVQKEFMTVLKKHGVKEITSIGTKFDPNLHQAIFEVEDDTKDAGIVVQENQKGFIIHDRLLRPSMVGVSKKSKKEQKK